jgi:Glycosyl hydrolases family 28/F5/8 type C domain
VVHVAASGNDGNKPDNTIDGDLATRWSAEGEQWIQWDLGEVHSIQRVRIAFHKGDTRRARFDLEVSSGDGGPGERVLQDRRASGTTTALETFDFGPVSGRYVRYVGHGNDHSAWNSLLEVEIWGTEDGAGEITPPAEQPKIVPTPGEGQVVTYPTPPSLHAAGLDDSALFRVVAGGKPVWTKKFKHGRTIHLAGLTVGAGEIPIKITVSEPFQSVQISPKRLRRNFQQDGNSFSFTISGPQKLIIFVRTAHGELDPLYLYADPLEENPPTPGSIGPHHYGPGLHDHVGKIELGSGGKVYLAGGAVVKGSIVARGASGVEVLGRGILLEDGDGTSILMEECQDVTVEGITVLDVQHGWSTHYEDCSGVEIRDVKIFSFEVNGDGIDPDGCRDFTVDRCLISTGDDCIAIKSRHRGVSGVKVLRTVLDSYPGGGGGDGVKIGTETFHGPITDVLVEDCDVVRDYGENSFDGHSAFSIVHRPESDISNVRYRNIRVEDRIEHKNFEIRMIANQEGSAISHDAGNGTVSDVTLEGIRWEVERDINLIGAGISGVHFRDCTVGGHALERSQVNGADDVPGITFS